MKKCNLWKIANAANRGPNSSFLLNLERALLDYPPLHIKEVRYQTKKIVDLMDNLLIMSVLVRHGRKEYIFVKNKNNKWEV